MPSIKKIFATALAAFTLFAITGIAVQMHHPGPKVNDDGLAINVRVQVPQGDVKDADGPGLGGGYV